MCYPNEATQILTWKSMRIPGHWVRAKYYRKDFPMLITVKFPKCLDTGSESRRLPIAWFSPGFPDAQLHRRWPLVFVSLVHIVCVSFFRAEKAAMRKITDAH